MHQSHTGNVLKTKPILNKPIPENSIGNQLSLEKKLPYLGEEQQDGSLKISEHLAFTNNQWRRPDYSSFASKKTQNEIDCLSVLIGIEGVEFCLYECTEISQKRILECKSHGQNYLQDPQWIACFEFKNLISDIRNFMDLGIQSGDLIQYDITPKDALTTGQGDFEFSFYCHYNINEFLQRAMEYSYPIPEEITSRIPIEDSNNREETDKFTTVYSPEWNGAPIEKWEDISITLTSHEMVRVQIGNETKRVTFSELGMQDKRKGDQPKRVWETLKIFALTGGIYPPDQSNFIKANFIKDFSIRAKELNQALKSFFGKTDSLYKEHYHTHKNWETKINFSSELQLSRDKLQEKNPFDEELDNIAKDLKLDSPYVIDKP